MVINHDPTRFIRCQVLHDRKPQPRMRRHQERDEAVFCELDYPDPEVRPHGADREDEYAVARESEPCS